jgi:hypothetical protein
MRNDRKEKSMEIKTKKGERGKNWKTMRKIERRKEISQNVLIFVLRDIYSIYGHRCVAVLFCVYVCVVEITYSWNLRTPLQSPWGCSWL